MTEVYVPKPRRGAKCYHVDPECDSLTVSRGRRGETIGSIASCTLEYALIGGLRACMWCSRNDSAK